MKETRDSILSARFDPDDIVSSNKSYLIIICLHTVMLFQTWIRTKLIQSLPILYGISTFLGYLMQNPVFVYKQEAFMVQWSPLKEMDMVIRVQTRTRLFAFHIGLIHFRKLWIQLFSLELKVNSRADWAL